MFKRSTAILMILLALVMLVGCGGSSTPGPTGTGTTGTGTAGTGPTGSSSTGSGTAGPERSRIVNVGFNAASQLDPHNFSSYGDELAIRFCYEPLIFSARNGTGLKPMLAKSWDIDPDGMSWTFYLQEGVTFTNGDSFTADDVVYSVERVINGSPEINFKNQYLRTLKDAEKIDDYTVKISFTESTPHAHDAFRCFGILPRKVHEQYGDAMFYDQGTDYFMVGTGPWIFDEWVDGQYNHYKKNPNYWNKAVYDPYFEEIYTRHIVEASSGVAAHVAGDLDMLSLGGGIPLDYLPLYNGTENKIQIINVPGNGWFWFGFNFKEGSMWNDKDVRSAFDMAIDRKLIIDTLYQGTAASIPGGYFGHPSIDGYDESLGEPVYDPVRAKELLANSTYDGRQFEILISGNTAVYEQLGMTLMDMLSKAGFNLEITLETGANTLARMSAGDYDVFMSMGSFADGNIQRQVNRILLDNEKTQYQSEELMSFIRGYLTEVDLAKRMEYARAINRYVFEEKAPHINLIHRSTLHAQNYGITGVNYSPDGVFNHVFIDWDPSLIP